MSVKWPMLLLALILPSACTPEGTVPSSTGVPGVLANGGGAGGAGGSGGGSSCADPAQTMCSGACRDTRTDPEHCGTCGRLCAAGDLCQQAQCVACTRCDAGSCVNHATDPLNCGTCGNDCRGAPCLEGRCSFNKLMTLHLTSCPEYVAVHGTFGLALINNELYALNLTTRSVVRLPGEVLRIASDAQGLYWATSKELYFTAGDPAAPSVGPVWTATLLAPITHIAPQYPYLYFFNGAGISRVDVTLPPGGAIATSYMPFSASVQLTGLSPGPTTPIWSTRTQTQGPSGTIYTGSLRTEGTEYFRTCPANYPYSSFGGDCHYLLPTAHAALAGDAVFFVAQTIGSSSAPMYRSLLPFTLGNHARSGIAASGPVDSFVSEGQLLYSLSNPRPGIDRNTIVKNKVEGVLVETVLATTPTSAENDIFSSIALGPTQVFTAHCSDAGIELVSVPK